MGGGAEQREKTREAGSGGVEPVRTADNPKTLRGGTAKGTENWEGIL